MDATDLYHDGCLSAGSWSKKDTPFVRDSAADGEKTPGDTLKV